MTTTREGMCEEYTWRASADRRCRNRYRYVVTLMGRTYRVCGTHVTRYTTFGEATITEQEAVTR